MPEIILFKFLSLSFSSTSSDIWHLKQSFFFARWHDRNDQAEKKTIPKKSKLAHKQRQNDKKNKVKILTWVDLVHIFVIDKKRNLI